MDALGEAIPARPQLTVDAVQPEVVAQAGTHLIEDIDQRVAAADAEPGGARQADQQQAEAAGEAQAAARQSRARCSPHGALAAVRGPQAQAMQELDGLRR